MGTSLLCRQGVRCTQPFLPAYSSCRTSRPVHQQSQTLQPQPQQAQTAHPQTLCDRESLPQQGRKVLQYSKAAQTETERRRKCACQQHITKQVASALALVPAAYLLQGAPAMALTIHQEPDNALSFPTWVIHISSVLEWGIAMALVWKYAEVTGMVCVLVTDAAYNTQIELHSNSMYVKCESWHTRRSRLDMCNHCRQFQMEGLDMGNDAVTRRSPVCLHIPFLL